MSVFEIKPSSLPSGELAVAWFDDEPRLWDDERLHKVGALAGEWHAPRFRLFRAERGVTDVLFNPNALAVSAPVREALRRFSEIEFLPIAIEGCGSFFVVHVTATVEVTPGFSVRRAPPPSGNVVELSEFPVGYAPSTAFFRVRQPADSAGGREGYCLRAMYANDEGAGALEAACGAYLDVRALRGPN
jgi:hypothetical protein